MKSCYADETLSISKGEFERPENLSIEVDCESYKGSNKKNPLDDDVKIDF
jgi:penicillin-binding protein 1A